MTSATSFELERTIATTATPADVWRIWSDPGSWHVWDPAVSSVALEGTFAEGAAGTMTLSSGAEVPVVLEIVETGSRYLDRLTLGELVIEVDHLVTAVDGGAEVTVRTTVQGPGAGDVGPLVTQDTPVALEALVRLAEG